MARYEFVVVLTSQEPYDEELGSAVRTGLRCCKTATSQHNARRKLIEDEASNVWDPELLSREQAEETYGVDLLELFKE